MRARFFFIAMLAEEVGREDRDDGLCDGFGSADSSVSERERDFSAEWRTEDGGELGRVERWSARIFRLEDVELDWWKRRRKRRRVSMLFYIVLGGAHKVRGEISFLSLNKYLHAQT